MTQTSTASQAAQAYRTQDIESADPLGLVVRVFDEAVVNLAQARAAMGANRASVKGDRIHRVCRCLDVLQSALDLERGKDVARNLDRLYAYLQRRLTEGHLRNDDAALGEVACHLHELASVWREAARRNSRAGSAAGR